MRIEERTHNKGRLHSWVTSQQDQACAQIDYGSFLQPRLDKVFDAVENILGVELFLPIDGIIR